MNVKFKSIADKGDFEKERLVIKVLNSCDIGEFVLLQTDCRNGSVTTGVKNTLWFPDEQVEPGDLIVVYSKSGRQNSTILKSGKKAHFFYWGCDGPLWNSTKQAPVIMHCSEWESASTDEL